MCVVAREVVDYWLLIINDQPKKIIIKPINYFISRSLNWFYYLFWTFLVRKTLDGDVLYWRHRHRTAFNHIIKSGWDFLFLRWLLLLIKQAYMNETYILWLDMFSRFYVLFSYLKLVFFEKFHFIIQLTRFWFIYLFFYMSLIILAVVFIFYMFIKKIVFIKIGVNLREVIYFFLFRN